MRVFLLLGCAAALAWGPVYAQETDAAAALPPPTTVEDPVDPDAVAALREMSAFLTSLNTFKLTATTSMDVITTEDQKVQMDSVTNYQAQKPNGLRIDLVSDMKTRQFYYNGSNFTINAPQLGYYSTVAAPPTIKEFLRQLYDKTGIELPLEDLFRWADEDTSDIDKLKSAFSVGTATIDGTRTDHWAFRTDDFDWEVWIQEGDQPLPRKLVIIDRTDPLRPMYSARLQWELNPALDPAVFTFAPGPDAIAIQMASAQGAGQ
jgi:hypothetical protein